MNGSYSIRVMRSQFGVRATGEEQSRDLRNRSVAHNTEDALGRRTLPGHLVLTPAGRGVQVASKRGGGAR
jgi:hypothetical protein